MQQQFNSLPEITKNIIILNLLMFLASITFGNFTYQNFVVYYVENEAFQPYQLVTSFFMHAGLFHIFMNMFVLFMFGSDVERTMGPKKFLFLYLSAGFGANLLSLGADYMHAHYLMSTLSPEQIMMAINNQGTNPDIINDATRELAGIWHKSALGASGATYGVLFTFAMLYPNRILYLLIPPMPIKAKYLAVGLAAMEFYQHVSNANTGIGHFVHLSGAAIAIGIVWFWRKQGAKF
ncbi:rhomboid family intramembrane serine protease [Aureispira anguillae]|uniref:Rhomboid family intramembrane serine protease n=1 Tax=Aureispira anguillae TaxID=2864201 RepID=A0A915YJ74_9BACT|nr:rhomboid family intramembrane serine protease [Aureispira anguillae]BDS14093.1 rhomboid family intramembrane serine protease [Aureispira anguillae]